jgi:hypothetical protein
MIDPAFLQDIREFDSIPALFAECCRCCKPGGLYLEFGVSSGHSLKQLRQIIPQAITLFGFDWFKGLPEPFLDSDPKGAFATDQRIKLPNTQLIEGLFQHTLVPFLSQHEQHCSFINIDCDLYSSASYVLTTLMDRIVPGSVIHFDEMAGYRGWETQEYRAFMEFLETKRCDYRYLGKHELRNVAVIIR